mgnify:CR=1 FL=1
MKPSVIFGILLFVALHAFDEMVLVIVMPTIASDLGSSEWYGMSIAGYVLASIIGMVWAGKQMDQKGPALVLSTACVFFLIGILLAVLSWGTISFFLARVLQGIGGGMCWTLAFGVISLMARPEDKPKAVASMDVAWVIPSLLAPVIGGFMVEYIHWRWIFAIQLLPLAGAFFLVTPQIRHLTGKQTRGQSNSAIILDASRIAVGSGLILYFLGTPLGWTWLGIIPAFWCIVKPLDNMMPDNWLKLDGPLSASLLVAALAFLTFYGMEAYQPLYLIEVRNLSTLDSGLVLTCASLSWMMASQLTARNAIPGNHSQRILIGLSLLLVGVGSLWFLLFSNFGYWTAYVSWMIAGLGMGVTFNTARSTAMLHTPPGEEGKVAGGISLNVSLGLGFAAGLGGAIKNQAYSYGYTTSEAVSGIWVMSMLAGVLTWLLLFYHYRKHQRTFAKMADNPV